MNPLMISDVRVQLVLDVDPKNADNPKNFFEVHLVKDEKITRYLARCSSAEDVRDTLVNTYGEDIHKDPEFEKFIASLPQDLTLVRA